MLEDGLSRSENDVRCDPVSIKTIRTTDRSTDRPTPWCLMAVTTGGGLLSRVNGGGLTLVCSGARCRKETVHRPSCSRSLALSLSRPSSRKRRDRPTNRLPIVNHPTMVRTQVHVGDKDSAARGLGDARRRARGRHAPTSKPSPVTLDFTL